MKKILITGASGVIGLNFLKHFSQRQADGELIEIHAVSKREIPELFIKEFCSGSIVFHNSIAELQDADFELIFNCGGPSQPSIFTSNPKLVIDANILEIPVLLMKLSEFGTFIQMGTSEIYSGCADLPCTEDHRGVLGANNPRRTYVLAKELAEIILQSYAKPEQKVLALRVSLVFGPGATLEDNRVLYELIKKGLKGEILLEGSPSAIRRYLYVDDFIEMTNILIVTIKPGFSTYNLGGVESLSIMEMAEEIGRQTGSSVQIKPSNDNRTVGAPAEVWVSLERFSEIALGYKPRIFSNGLTETIQWTKKLLENGQ